MPYKEFLGTRFYREWFRPQSIVDGVTGALEKSGTSAVLFTVFRHRRDSVVDDKARRRMRLILPHMRRAVLISKIIDLKTAEAASFAGTLDGIGAGMFLVDARGRTVHANASGHAILAKGCLLRAVGGKLAPTMTLQTRRCTRYFLRPAAVMRRLAQKGIAVPLVTREEGRYVAHVLPLTSGERRRAGAGYAAVAALFVHNVTLDKPSPPEALAKAFRLTPSELRVLLGIVEVGGVPETAEALGIGKATVRTHLLRLYAKTGTSRQAELVKLVAGYSTPLVG